MATFHPYLFFGGNCREAFTRYQEIFGGELTLMRMGDAPSDDPVPAEMADVIIHAAITSPESVLMGSDDPSGDFETPRGIQVTVQTSDLGEAKRIFDALAEGGQVTQELIQTFFSSGFGMCVDRFGTPWMVVAPEPAG
jgi:PhnB protein